RTHSVADEYPGNGASKSSRSGARKLLSKLSMLTQLHAWKADFNQCTGRQLISALSRASRKYAKTNGELPFVLIGHSKQFTRKNEQSLRLFLEHVGADKPRYRFANLSETAAQRWN